MEQPLPQYWQNCIDFFKQNVPNDIYVAWFEPIQFVSYEGGGLKIKVPSRSFAEMFDTNYVNYFMQVVHHYMGAGIKLEYIIEKDPITNAVPEPLFKTQPTADKGKEINRYRVTPQQNELPPLESQLNRRYTFDNFVEGSSNKLSRSVGLSIADDPGKSAFNPFFLYGPSGVGKTHLVNAIGVHIKEKNPNKRVLFVSAHVFKTQYTDSVINNTQNDFINFYQSIEVLIIDDI